MPAVHAAPSHTLNVKLGTGVEVFTSVKLNQTITHETVLPYLRNVRAYMYEQNVLFNGEKLQDVVTDAGLSKDEYVNGLQWSGDMERIAVQRAVEEYYSGTITADTILTVIGDPVPPIDIPVLTPVIPIPTITPPTTPRAPQNPSDDSSSGLSGSSGSSTGGSILLVLLSILAAVGIGEAMIGMDALPAMWF